MKRAVSIILVLALLAGAGWFVWTRWGGEIVDRYDYAAAFEAQAPGSTAKVVDIHAIAGKTPEALKATLGAPLSCETSLYSSRCSYSPGATEVVFIDGKADWITVKALGETKLDMAALPRIGLAQAAPAERDAAQLTWRGLEGLREVQAVGSEDQIEYIRVKASH